MCSNTITLAKQQQKYEDLSYLVHILNPCMMGYRIEAN